MATLDFTADSGNRNAAGIRSHVHRYGPYETHVLVVDEKKVAEYYAANSITATATDVHQLLDLKKGDVVLGGSVEVVAPGGAATATLIFGVAGGDVDGLSGGAVFDADAAAGTMAGSVPASYPAHAIADGTVDFTAATAVLFQAAASATGRWRFTVMIYRGYEARNLGFESYPGDPNLPPQN